MHEYDKQDKEDAALSEILLIAKDIGKTPTIVEYKRRNPSVGIDTILGLFGSWNVAIQKAGLEINPTQSPPRNIISRDKIISELLKASDHYGYFPSHPKFSAYASISRGPVEREFGSWKKAKDYIIENHADDLTFKIKPNRKNERARKDEQSMELLSRISCSLRNIPRNEMETIILFAQLSKTMGYEILKAQVEYPDLVVEKDGKILKMEAEYLSSNYLSHGHPLDEGTICLCWRKDTEIDGIEIVDLETVVRTMNKK
ncbi:homing endonuclease associated repeat-containing protein [Membranihabitans marinus]|uniref:homing endonuclease associated repeat-containing protein n=1 Tax=Membranihabitans marinus TaxID=1227546 RepID=UPI001F4644E4|nr:hypothetical protein [Membranihabitans marinus]